MQEPHWIHLEHEGRDAVLTVSPDQQNRNEDAEEELDMFANLHPQLWNLSGGMNKTCFKVLASRNWGPRACWYGWHATTASPHGA